MAASKTIYRIGHSNHDWSHFVSLLRAHGVTAVADVRSHPYSRLAHFRRDQLQALLWRQQLEYVYLGQELGARREEIECYVGRQVDFERVARLPAFLEGLARVQHGAPEHVIALMCAEREPLNCHRALLVSRHLADRGYDVLHILADGSIESQAQIVQRIIGLSGLDPLFDSSLSDQQIERRAYAEHGRRIAFHMRENRKR